MWLRHPRLQVVIAWGDAALGAFVLDKRRLMIGEGSSCHISFLSCVLGTKMELARWNRSLNAWQVFLPPGALVDAGANSTTLAEGSSLRIALAQRGGSLVSLAISPVAIGGWGALAARPKLAIRTPITAGIAASLMAAVLWIVMAAAPHSGSHPVVDALSNRMRYAMLRVDVGPRSTEQEPTQPPSSTAEVLPTDELKTKAIAPPSAWKSVAPRLFQWTDAAASRLPSILPSLNKPSYLLDPPEDTSTERWLKSLDAHPERYRTERVCSVALELSERQQNRITACSPSDLPTDFVGLAQIDRRSGRILSVAAEEGDLPNGCISRSLRLASVPQFQVDEEVGSGVPWISTRRVRIHAYAGNVTATYDKVYVSGMYAGFWWQECN